MTPRVVLLSTGAHLPPGLLTAAAWDALRSAPVGCGDPAHHQLDALRASGVAVTVLGDGPSTPGGADALAGLLAARAADARGHTAVWLLAADGEPALVAALTGLPAVARGELEIVAVEGSVDPPGAALLAAVEVMDRLRSPGGCPWDAEQTHTSLAPYLLEEAYEAYQSIEDGDLAALREEIGDVLMQVLFHARVAAEEEPAAGGGWDVDEVAAELVAKLVRRHPHVFADTAVGGASEVEANWERIKRAEKGRTSATDGVPLSQPALSLAAKLQRRAARAGVPVDLMLGIPDVTPARLLDAFAGLAAEAGWPAYEVDADGVGALLLAAVALARGAGLDPEAALRGAARRFADDLAAAERAARALGADPTDAGPATWRTAWPAH